MSDLPKGITRIYRDDPLAKTKAFVERFGLNKPIRIKRKQRKVQHAKQPKFNISAWRVLKAWLTGKQYQFQLTIRYNYEMDENGHWPDSKYISRTVFVSFKDPAILHNSHALNKELAPALIKSIPRIYLRNGLVQIQNVNFLGVW